jgi:hypothetical protein
VTSLWDDFPLAWQQAQVLQPEKRTVSSHGNAVRVDTSIESNMLSLASSYEFYHRSQARSKSHTPTAVATQAPPQFHSVGFERFHDLEHIRWLALLDELISFSSSSPGIISFAVTRTFSGSGADATLILNTNTDRPSNLDRLYDFLTSSVDLSPNNQK